LVPDFNDKRNILRKIVHLVNIFASIVVNKIVGAKIIVLNARDKEFFQHFYSKKDIYILKPFLAINDQAILDKLPRKSYADREVDIVFIGRLHYQKGIEDLIFALNILFGKIGCSISRVVIVGDGSVAYRKYLMSLTRDRRVEFIGYLDDEAKFKILTDSKIAVFPSHNESQGLVVSEALAAGCKVILSDIPAFREHYDSASFFKMGSVESLANIILDEIELGNDLSGFAKYDCLTESISKIFNKA